MKRHTVIQKQRGEKGKNSPEFYFFVHAPLTKYKGKYIAILGKRVVASGVSVKKVWEEARKKYPKQLPTIAKIPKEEVLVMLWK